MSGTRYGPRTPLDGCAYVDRLTLASLFPALRAAEHRGRLRYFGATPGGRAAARLLHLAGLLPPVEQVINTISDARDADGTSPFIRAWLAGRRVCARYREGRLAPDPLIRAFGERFDAGRVMLHFERLAEIDVRQECLRVELIRWLGRPANANGSARRDVVVLRRAPWTAAVREHALAHGLGFASYRELPDLGRAVGRLGRAIRSAAEHAWRGGRHPSPPRAVVRAAGGDPRVAIGVQFGHRTLQQGVLRRSEFFWLDGSERLDRDVVLYGAPAVASAHVGSTGPRATPSDVRIVSGVPSDDWRSFVSLGLSLVIRPWVAQWLRGRRSGPYVARHLLSLLRDFLRWRSFFRANGVRVTVAPFASDATVGQVLALADLGGVSTAYQYSISNIIGPAALLTPGADVAFVFSERFARLWDGVAAPPDQIVPTGFVYDAAIHACARQASWREARARLAAHGATWVIAFFDENSVDAWHSAFTHVSAALDYEFLLHWLFEDPTLGLVLKPKKSGNLVERVAPVAALLERAIGSGRCVLLAGDTLVGSTYPAEAALMADVAVGKLTGGTAALEAWLCGKPTLLVDTDGFRDHPFWEWGAGTVVHRDWPSVRSAIERYRRDATEGSRFGDWSPAGNELDPFRDGRAAARMREYVLALALALDAGASRAEAIASASAAGSLRATTMRSAVAGRG